MIVLRPPPGSDVWAVAEQQAGIVEGLRTSVPQRPDVLGALLRASIACAGAFAAADSDGPRVDQALRLAIDAGVALFSLATGEGPVNLRLGDEHLRCPATGPTPSTDADALKLAMAVAAIGRDDAALRVLAAVPPSVLHAAGADPATLLYARALQAMWRASPDAQGLVAAALATATPAQVRRLSAEMVTGELRPEIELLQAIVARDGLEVNRRLVRGLESHLQLYGSGARVHDPEHFLAIGLLGLASLADRLGLRIEAQSDYLPLRLIKGELDETTDPAPKAVRTALCPMCGSPIAPRSRTCGTCRSDLANSPVLSYELDQLAELPRVSCRACGESMLADAHVCPTCGVWQSRDGKDELATDEVALRPFPPEYQMHVVSRHFEPSRLAVLLRGAPPTDHELIEQLRSGGIEVLHAGPARYREAPDAPWELALELRTPGDQQTHSFQIWPEQTSKLPRFDITGLDPGAHTLVVFTHFSRSLLDDLHRQIRVAAAAVPDGVGVVDLSTARGRTAAWLREAAWSPVPPEAGELYAVRERRSPTRAWLHTVGLARCGCFELEMLDLPPGDVDRYAALLDAAARRLIEVGDTVPAEEQPFSAAQGVDLVWVPLAWAQAELPDAYGTSEEDRRDAPRGTSAALLCADPSEGFRHAPLSTLAPLLATSPRRSASQLDLDRDRRLAQATFDRFLAYRASPGEGWAFSVRIGEAWDPYVDQVDVDDWRIDTVDGRIVPADALEERAQAWQARRSQARLGPTPPGMDSRDRTPRGAPVRVPPDVTLPLYDPSPTVPWPAYVLALGFPGAGHLFVGDRRRAAAFFVAGLLSCGLANLVAVWDLRRGGGR